MIDISGLQRPVTGTRNVGWNRRHGGNGLRWLVGNDIRPFLWTRQKNGRKDLLVSIVIIPMKIVVLKRWLEPKRSFVRA